MTEVERAAVVDVIARTPKLGELIVGSGGCRKVRVAGRGFGKSGGYRVITYYGGEAVPVFLLWVLSKGRAANLTDAQVNTLAQLTRTLADSLARGLG